MSDPHAGAVARGSVRLGNRVFNAAPGNHKHKLAFLHRYRISNQSIVTATATEVVFSEPSTLTSDPDELVTVSGGGSTFTFNREVLAMVSASIQWQEAAGDFKHELRFRLNDVLTKRDGFARGATIVGQTNSLYFPWHFLKGDVMVFNAYHEQSPGPLSIIADTAGNASGAGCNIQIAELGSVA